MASKTINREDERLINEVIGPQLRKGRQVEISMNGKTFMIDYGLCMLDKGNIIYLKDVIVMPTGFGSGWRGIARLGFNLAEKGHQVVMVSLPGCGNSADPFPQYYKTESFVFEAEALAKFMQKVLPGKKVHLVGHSMAADIVTELAYANPELVASLTLLCPAGFEKRGRLELLAKFFLNGILHDIEFRGDPTWTKLCDFLPAEKSAFTPSRLPQRFNEWQRLCRGGDLMLRLEHVAENIPTACMWGMKDFVLPEEKSSIADSLKKVQKISLPLWHNVTMFGSEITAAEIDSFLYSLHK